MRRTLQLAGLVSLAASAAARADAPSNTVEVGGYYRLQALTDFQGGNGRLGLSTIYGRLLNEGPYGIVELRYNAIGDPKSADPFAQVTFRVEGASFLGTDAGQGSLSNYAITNFGVNVGNILLEHVTWRLGILWVEPNDLDLYDMFLDDVLYGVAGVSAHYQVPLLDLTVGFGDAGWYLHPQAYDTVYTGGGWFRFHPDKHFEIGGGGQAGFEPSSPGNVNAPYQTPGVTYLQYYQQDAVQGFFQNLGTTQGPVESTLFPHPSPRSSSNWKAVGYLGFGKFGPLKWNSFYVHYLKQPPLTSYTETYQGAPYTIYIHDLTDQEYEFMAGDESLWTIVPHKLDLALDGLYGVERNFANVQIAGYDNYTFVSGVARLQYYLTRTVHLLVETSLAEEHSLNGNLFRNHVDSPFTSTGGINDPLGLDYGDAAYRDTWQGKGGIVFNPNGPGIYNRPSLRLLYGLQWSSAQDAFQSGYVNSLNQYNQFQGALEQHWHSVVGADLEGWF